MSTYSIRNNSSYNMQFRILQFLSFHLLLVLFHTSFLLSALLINIRIKGNITISNGYLKLPKIGQVRLKQHRSVPSEYRLKSVTVSQTPSGKYYASILFEYENQVQEKEMQKFLGLDFSMCELYRDSNGKEPAYPRYYRNAEKKLAREQRKLSKMQKGSNNRNKQRLKVAKIHEKVFNQNLIQTVGHTGITRLCLARYASNENQTCRGWEAPTSTGRHYNIFRALFLFSSVSPNESNSMLLNLLVAIKFVNIF